MDGEKGLNTTPDNGICKHHCIDCEGMDHHWMFDADDEHPEGCMVCKHCDATREVRDDDLDL